MSQLSKPRQALSVIVHGRKLKGEKMGRYLSLPLGLCERLGIDVGDLLELEDKKITKTRSVDVLA